jgi:hypothetical protein
MSTDVLRPGKSGQLIGVSRMGVIRHCRRAHGVGDGGPSMFQPGECWQVDFGTRKEWRISTAAIERITGRKYEP